jgi:hypothetical protein
MAEPSLYGRLGGVFAIAAVVDHFSDAVVKNPFVGQGSSRTFSSAKDRRTPTFVIGIPTTWTGFRGCQ